MISHHDSTLTATDREEGAYGPPTLLEVLESLPAICSLCGRLIALPEEDRCIECYIEDEPEWS